MKTTTVVLDQYTTQKVCLYKFDVIETLLKTKKSHAYFLAQQDVRRKLKKHDKLEDAVLVKIQVIRDESSDMKELASPRKLDALQTNLQDKIKK